MNLEEVLHEVHRILKPNRLLVLTVPNKFFPFEQHEIKFGIKKFLGQILPFFPYWPSLIRKKAEQARVFSVKGIGKLLSSNNFSVKYVDYTSFMSTLTKKKALKTLLGALDEIIEKRQLLKFLSTTLFVIATKN